MPSQINAALRPSYAGENNPNFKDSGKRVCQNCGCEYKSYNNTRKYCSQNCYVLARPKKPNVQLKLRLVKVPKVRSGRVIRSFMQPCAQCGKEFRRYPSQTRIYCTYDCHLKSGGAFRAGVASAKAAMKYGPKKDANHNEVFEEMRKHCAVYDFSSAGCGLPDGIAWVKDQWRLFDVKNPKTGYGRRGLNKVQKRWLGQWKGGPVYLIYSAEEAARFGRGEMDGIKVIYPEDALRETGAIA